MVKVGTLLYAIRKGQPITIMILWAFVGSSFFEQPVSKGTFVYWQKLFGNISEDHQSQLEQ